MKKTYQVQIVYDGPSEDPRTFWDNVTTMICFHKRYDLGDKHSYKSDNYDGWDELKEEIEKDFNVLMIKPLYLFDHSGITISTGSFNDRWDSGQVGWVIIEEKKWKNMMGEDMDRSEERLYRLIEEDVKTYDQYLRGEVYGYRIIETEVCNLGHTHQSVVESCMGYYNEDECLSEAKKVMESLRKEVV